MKGKFARRLVKLCLSVLMATLVWAAVIKTVALCTGQTVDLTDILTFAAASFGGELLLLLVKRVLAKRTGGENPSESEDTNA